MDKCCNCGSTEGICYHHVIPRSLGGTDNPSNLVPLCTACHYLLHQITNKRDSSLNHGALVKAGIKKSSRQQGRKPGALDKLTSELETDIWSYIQNRKTYTQNFLMEKHHIARNTLKKYILLIFKQKISEEIERMSMLNLNTSVDLEAIEDFISCDAFYKFLMVECQGNIGIPAFILQVLRDATKQAKEQLDS